MSQTATKAAIRGMACDNPSCSYQNSSIGLDEYHHYLNKSCPECGENLLTEEDHAQIQALLSILDIQASKPNNGISDGDM